MKLLPRSRLHDLFLLLAMAAAWYANAVSLAVGGTLVILGLAMQLWSKSHLIRNTQVCTEGPYALCRHPFYLGNALFDIALVVMSGCYWLLILYPIAFYLAYLPVMRQEEAKLVSLFGSEYLEFRRTTGMIVPRPWLRWGHLRAPATAGNLVKEREVSRLLRHLSYPLLVLLAARVWQPPPRLTVGNLLMAGGVVACQVLAVVVYKTIERAGRAAA